MTCKDCLHHDACFAISVAFGLEFNSEQKHCDYFIPASDWKKVEHGKWIIGTDGMLHCSHCNQIARNRIKIDKNTIYDITPIKEWMKYCPVCGAKMDFDEDEKIMREILFRGRCENGKWVYGQIDNFGEDTAIVNVVNGKVVHHIVDEDTIGQYTGLTDKNGTKIFEGDIVMVAVGTIYKIEYKPKYAKFCMCNQTVAMAGCNLNQTEVIGNIHDNPELLKV